LPFRRLLVWLYGFAFCTLIAGAAVPGDDAAPDIWDLPIVDRVAILQPNLATAAMAPNCSVAPLPELQDEETVQFESLDSPDTAGLLPAMSEALEKFRKLVAAAGGSFDLKSAYRPITYQEHLQQVWFKWMRELRFNRQSGCQALRAQVQEEFTRHKLMPTQIPVTDSDHTRGMAFDAAIMMPRLARLKKIRVSVDYLARLAGLRRPDVRRDPVHFKLVAVTVARAQGDE
jgi:hypothetical protein